LDRSLPLGNRGTAQNAKRRLRKSSKGNFSGTFGNFRELSGTFGNFRELLGTFRNFQELSGTFRNFQELSGTFRNFQELSGTFRNFQELSVHMFLKLANKKVCLTPKSC
jgi:hypothetical protein